MCLFQSAAPAIDCWSGQRVRSQQKHTVTVPWLGQFDSEWRSLDLKKRLGTRHARAQHPGRRRSAAEATIDNCRVSQSLRVAVVKPLVLKKYDIPGTPCADIPGFRSTPVKTPFTGLDARILHSCSKNRYHSPFHFRQTSFWFALLYLAFYTPTYPIISLKPPTCTPPIMIWFACLEKEIFFF